MRVAGDAEACRRAGRLLGRAHDALQGSADDVRAVRQGVPSWRGRAVDRWAAAVLVHADAGKDLAQRTGALAGALLRHADDLELLQARARRLVELAATGPLLLTDDGRVGPLPYEPSRQDDLRYLAVERPRLQQLRLELQDAVRRLQQDEDDLHDRLRRAATSLAAGRAGGPSGWWSAPPVVVQGAAEALRRASAARLAAAAGTAVRGVPVGGVVYGTVVDVALGDRTVPYAVTKGVTSTVAGSAAATTVTAVGTGVLGVAAAPVVVGVAVGIGVAVVFDQVLGDRLFPAPDPDRRRGPVPAAPAPSPGPTRQPAQPARPAPQAVPAPQAGPAPAPAPRPVPVTPLAPRPVSPAPRPGGPASGAASGARRGTPVPCEP